MKLICLHARQILELKSMEVQGIGDPWVTYSQDALAKLIADSLSSYHFNNGSGGRILDIYYLSLRWLMNDLESNSK